jgi:hypothetical protein
MVLQAVRAAVENMASSIAAIKRFMWDLLAKSDMDKGWPTARQVLSAPPCNRIEA